MNLDLLECTICLQPYSAEEEHCPRVLSCGHSPCHSCLNELPRHWSDSASRDCLIRCPECNQWVKMPLQGASGLPKNIQLLRLIPSSEQTGELLLSASYDKTICIWSLHTNSHLETLRGHQHRILALAIDPKASLCFSGDYGGCIFVWAIESVPRQEPVTTWYEHRDWRYSGVHALAISKSGYLYSGSGDKTIKAWSLQDYSLVSTMEGHKSLVSALFVNEELLYSGSWDGTVRLWWLGDHSPLAVLGDNVPTHLSAVHALTMCNGTLIAVYNNGLLKVWKDDILLKSLQVHNDAIISANAEHDWIFIGSWDKTIKAFNINTILENPTPKVIDCNSVVTSLLLHQGKLFAGFANKAIKVFS